MEDIRIDEQPKSKPKRQLTQAQLDQLAKAREKANAVRKQNAEMKKKEKHLKELQRQVQEEEIDEEIERYSKGAPKKKPKPLLLPHNRCCVIKTFLRQLPLLLRFPFLLFPRRL